MAEEASLFCSAVVSVAEPAWVTEFAATGACGADPDPSKGDEGVLVASPALLRLMSAVKKAETCSRTDPGRRNERLRASKACAQHCIGQSRTAGYEMDRPRHC